MANSYDYIFFESNQVLTDNDLNRTFDYLDKQTRLTRNKAIGIGIVCGFDIAHFSNSSIIKISKGCGITSQGYLITQPDMFYRYYMPYTTHDKPVDLLTDETNSIPFFNGYALKNQLYVLLDDNAFTNLDEDTQATARLLPFPSSSFFYNYVVVLFLDATETDLKNCDVFDCNNNGSKISFDVKALLVSKQDLPALTSVSGNAQTDPALNLEHQIYFKRFNVPYAELQTSTDILNAFTQLIDDFTLTRVANAYMYSYEKYKLILSEQTNPFTGLLNQLQIKRDSIVNSNKLFIQYFYDYINDLVQAYYEFTVKASGVITMCCPDEDAFPLHLVLGEAAVDTNTYAAGAYRQVFIHSSLFNQENSEVSEAVFLFERMRLLTQDFTVFTQSAFANALIKITPSQYEHLWLSKRAIPYYYRLNDLGNELYKYWSYYKTTHGSAAYNFSYNANLYSTNDAVLSPLKYDIEYNNFFRIEGHIGKNYVTVLNELTTQVQNYNLPFDVVAIQAGGDETTITESQPDCSFQDLNSLYAVLKSDFYCLLGKLMCAVASETYTSPFIIFNPPIFTGGLGGLSTTLNQPGTTAVNPNPGNTVTVNPGAFETTVNPSAGNVGITSGAVSHINPSLNIESGAASQPISGETLHLQNEAGLNAGALSAGLGSLSAPQSATPLTGVARPQMFAASTGTPLNIGAHEATAANLNIGSGTTLNSGALEAGLNPAASAGTPIISSTAANLNVGSGATLNTGALEAGLNPAASAGTPIISSTAANLNVGSGATLNTGALEAGLNPAASAGTPIISSTATNLGIGTGINAGTIAAGFNTGSTTPISTINPGVFNPNTPISTLNPGLISPTLTITPGTILFGYQKGTFLKQQSCYNQLAENSVGKHYTANIPSGSINFSSFDPSNLSNNFLTIIDLIEEVISTIYFSTLSTLDVASLTSRLTALSNYLLQLNNVFMQFESNQDTQNYFTDYEEHMDLFDEVINSCYGEKFTAAKNEFTSRITLIKQQMLFTNYYKQHQGIEHKSGVPKGGTFVIVYNAPVRRIPISDNNLGQFTAATQLTANTLSSSQLSASTLAATQFAASPAVSASRLGLFSQPLSSQLSTVNQPVANQVASIAQPLSMQTALSQPTLTKTVTTPINLSTNELTQRLNASFSDVIAVDPGFIDRAVSILTPTLTPPVLTPPIFVPTIADYVVIADFYIPYICCSDCPPVSYIFTQPEPTVVFDIQPKRFLFDDAHNYPFTTSEEVKPSDFDSTSNPKNLNLLSENNKLELHPAMDIQATINNAPLTYKNITVNITIVKPDATFTLTPSTSPSGVPIITVAAVNTDATSYAWTVNGQGDIIESKATPAPVPLSILLNMDASEYVFELTIAYVINDLTSTDTKQSTYSPGNPGESSGSTPTTPNTGGTTTGTTPSTNPGGSIGVQPPLTTTTGTVFGTNIPSTAINTPVENTGTTNSGAATGATSTTPIERPPLSTTTGTVLSTNIPSTANNTPVENTGTTNSGAATGATSTTPIERPPLSTTTGTVLSTNIPSTAINTPVENTGTTNSGAAAGATSTTPTERPPLTTNTGSVLSTSIPSTAINTPAETKSTIGEGAASTGIAPATNIPAATVTTPAETKITTNKGAANAGIASATNVPAAAVNIPAETKNIISESAASGRKNVAAESPGTSTFSMRPSMPIRNTFIEDPATANLATPEKTAPEIKSVSALKPEAKKSSPAEKQAIASRSVKAANEKIAAPKKAAKKAKAVTPKKATSTPKKSNKKP